LAQILEGLDKRIHNTLLECPLNDLGSDDIVFNVQKLLYTLIIENYLDNDPTAISKLTMFGGFSNMSSVQKVNFYQEAKDFYFKAD